VLATPLDQLQNVVVTDIGQRAIGTEEIDQAVDLVYIDARTLAAMVVANVLQPAFCDVIEPARGKSLALPGELLVQLLR
jgi:stage V sporulation protein SpoVS